jgi:predicted metal-dependent enzyme (double-stranded beta helix superfamily)
MLRDIFAPGGPALTQTVAIDEFVARLRRIPADDFHQVGKIYEFVRANPVTPESIERYLVWDAQHYTRNLIDRSAHYELIAICWEPGQVSAVHNHAGQHCWMAVPTGRLRVQNYRVHSEDAVTGHCELEPTDVEYIEPGHPVAVDPAEPIHRVDNPRDAGARAVSLHIYSHPIDRCLVYSVEKHTCGSIDLHYTTEYGKASAHRA